MKRLVPIVLAALSLCCGGPPDEPRPGVAAFVHGAPIGLEDFDAYLGKNLIAPEDEDAADSPELDGVKSRLLDALIEEHLLIHEAERRGIDVSPAEIEAFFEFGAESVDDSRSVAELEREARHHLMIQKLQEQVLLDLPEVSDAEAAAYAERNRERLLPPRPVELRALRLRSKQQAERIYNEIRRRRMTFDEAVIAHEPSPGQAQPRRISWDALSEEVRDTLKDLKPGQVGKPVERYGEVYLFRVESWLREPGDLADELSLRARGELQAKRRQEALEKLIHGLRAKAGVRILSENLPFVYETP